MNWPPGTHSNTFGGNLLASAAALAALKFMEREDIGTRAKQLGDHLMMRLRELQSKYPAIGDVRGLGLMIGVEIVKHDGAIDPDTRDRIVVEGFKEGIRTTAMRRLCHTFFTASSYNKRVGGY